MPPLLQIWQTLQEWDQALFRTVNTGMQSPFLDWLAPWLRNSLTWVPLYLLILFYVVRNYRETAWIWILFFIATVGLTDLTGTYAFKHVFHRLRPCADPDFSMQVHLVIRKCAGGYSFISNHAANHFGMAVFFFITMRRQIGKWAWLAILWALLIIFAQVYVGVHYPLDVMCGALLGILYGSLTGSLFNKRFGFPIFIS